MSINWEPLTISVEKNNKNANTESVGQKFERVQSVRQLRRWAHTVNQGGICRKTLGRICEYTWKNFKAPIDAGLTVHDSDLKRWVL